MLQATKFRNSSIPTTTFRALSAGTRQSVWNSKRAKHSSRGNERSNVPARKVNSRTAQVSLFKRCNYQLWQNETAEKEKKKKNRKQRKAAMHESQTRRLTSAASVFAPIDSGDRVIMAHFFLPFWNSSSPFSPPLSLSLSLLRELNFDPLRAKPQNQPQPVILSG